MATNYDKTLNTQAKAKNAMERLAQVENAVEGLLKLVDRELGAVVNQINQLSDVINGTVQVVGLDKVQVVLQENAAAKLKSEEDAIAEGQLEGRITPVAAVPAQGIVGYKEYDANGQLRIPGKYYKNIGQLSKDAQALLVGKEVGFKTSIGNGATMEIVEVYEFLPPPPMPDAAAANGATAPEAPVVEATAGEVPAGEVVPEETPTTPEA